jgi:hypothetical protein
MGHADPAGQARLEIGILDKLHAMKHGNPATLDWNAVEDWSKRGTTRLGPDESDFGQMAICFAVQMAGQLSELAVMTFSALHLSGETQGRLVGALAALAARRLALHDWAAKRWSSFP